MTTATRARRPLLDVLGCFALGVGIGVIPWLFRERFYFHDDIQHQHLPTFLHIGRLLREGEWPILTLASFTSGNLLGEYQYALLNPVSLALYAVLPSIPSLTAAMLFLACFYYGVLTAGTYALARTYGVERWGALVAGVVIASNNLISYWFASSWFPIFVSLTWFVWAWAFLARAGKSRLDWLLAVVFAYLIITAGWPQTTIMLGLVGVLTAVENWRSRGPRSAAAVILALAAATLFSAIALLALASLSEIATRFRGIVNGNVFVPNLRDLLVMSSPFHRGFMSWGGYKLTGTPMFFLAWFVMPLLPLIRWSRVEWRRPEIVTLLVVVGLCLLATQGPEEFYTLRWPFRWTPYLHIALTVLFLALFSMAGFAPVTPLRGALVALLLALDVLSSLQADPASWPLHLAGFGICIVAVAVVLAAADRRIRLGAFAVVSLLLFTGTHALFTTNTDVPDWGLSAEVTTGLEPNAAPSAYTLYLGWLGAAEDTRRLEEYQTGMMPRVREAATVNGYTPIGHRYSGELLCMSMFGETCPELGPRLFERDPATGRRYVDLFRINRLIAHKGPHLDRLLPALGPAWELEFDGRRTQRFVRRLPNRLLPGTVSWVSPGAELEAVGGVRPSREEIRIAGRRDEPVTIVFARQYWPGYNAEFEGETLPVRAHQGIFVAVDVPAGEQSGILTLRFRPPYVALGLAAAGIGFGIVLAVIGFPWLGGFAEETSWLGRAPAGLRPQERYSSGPKALRGGHRPDNLGWPRDRNPVSNPRGLR